MKKVLTIFMVACYALCVQAAESAASAHAILVEDGKLWKVREYDFWPIETEPDRYRDFEQRFDGTKEINGKIYHVLKAKHTYPTVSEEYEVAYMREENGKVFTIANTDLPTSIFASFYCESFICNEEEVMTYDFTLKEGDTYSWFPSDKARDEFFENSLQDKSSWWVANAMCWLTYPIEVLKTDYLNIFDNDLAYQKVRYTTKALSRVWDSWFFERVGAFNGMLPYPGLEYPLETGGIYVIEVYDPDGTLIYSTKEVNSTPAVGADGTFTCSFDGSALNIAGATGVATVTVHDLSGATVLTAQVNESGTVNLECLPKGVYIVRMSDANETRSLKIAI
ncbi:MAG: T9SS type A sorting domain-containing protein [Muribaculaceae bacterium]|nr:T9SS type A sorting domain-containing protein [Muribaculaceae bacterium]